MRRLRHLLRLTLLALVASAAWGMFGSTSAHAHGDLIDAIPGPGDRVATGSELTALRFAELADDGRALVAILDEDGDPVAVGAAQTNLEAGAVCAKTAPLTLGVHTLEYSVTSNDGDLIRGEYTFEVVAQGDQSDYALTTVCDDLVLAEPGEAQTIDEMGTGSFPSWLPYLLGVLLVIALGLVIRRVRADRETSDPIA